MLTLDQGAALIKIARRVIELHLEDKPLTEVEQLASGFTQPRGVFVTLYTFPGKQLRGCIGLPYPTTQLGKAIIEAAKSSAFADPRFPELTKDELKRILIEISVLTPPKLIEAEPAQLPNKIKIGRDGLICSCHGSEGLLLPQVAPEQGWDAKEFLRQTCLKAGLLPEAWKDPECKFYCFQAQIFAEQEPAGKVIEKK